MPFDPQNTIMGAKLGKWPWEGPMAADDAGLGQDDGRQIWEKFFPDDVVKSLDVGQAVCVISPMASFVASTGRGSVNAKGWMVDVEILDGNFGHFYYHVEKRVSDESSAITLAKRVMDLVDSKTLIELEHMPKSGKIQMSTFEGMRPELSMDPNDRVRQQTHSRSKSFPYDRDISYGSDLVPDDTGAARQVSYGGQLTPWFVKDDDGDIAKEASGTPYNFGMADRGSGGSGGLTIPGQSRGFAGSTKDNLDVDVHWDVFGEDSFVRITDGDLRDLQAGELRDISMGGMGLVGQGLQPRANQQPAASLVDALGHDEDMWAQEVRSRQLRALAPVDEEYEDLSLGECFAVYNEESDEVLSLLETLDWER